MTTSTFARWAPVGGIAFVALWVAAFAFGLTQGPGDTDAEIRDYYADNGNREREVSSSFLMIGAGLLLLWFLAGLRDRLVRAEGHAGTRTAVAFGAGLVACSLWFVAAVGFMTIPYTIGETDEFTLDPDLYRLVSETAYLLWAAGTAVSAVLVFVTSLLARTSEVFPAWLAWLGLVAGPATLLTALFVGFLVFLGWVLLTSIVLLRSREEPSVEVAAPV